MLTDREFFKAALLSTCADQGLSTAETIALVKSANAQLEKRGEGGLLATLGTALGAGATGLGAKALGYAKMLPAAAMTAPLVAGGIGGYALANATDVSDETPQEIQQRELIDEYRRYAERARHAKILKDYRNSKGRTGRPLLS